MNVTHSVDAYVLRSVIRRASFDVKKVQAAYQLLAADIDRRSEGYDPVEATITDELQTMLDIYKYSQMLDVSILDYIDEDQVQFIPNELLIKLHNTVYEMLKRGSSPVVPVHDSFGSLPTHCNTVRYWYKEICSELAESNMLAFLVSQITGKHVTYIKKSNDLANKIRNSNYGIC